MARKTVIVSDISGEEVSDGEAAKLTIAYGDARRGIVVLDVKTTEVEHFATLGTKQSRRGRRPGQTTGKEAA